MKKSVFICSIVIFVCLFSAPQVWAQSEEQSGLVKTAKGMLVVWNEPGNFYTIEIIGKSIEPGEQELLFIVDGKFLQMVTTTTASFLKPADGKDKDDKAILTKHQQWEVDYINETLKTKIKVDSAWIKLTGGQTALAWSYEPPKMSPDSKVKRQLYLTTLKRDHVLVLNTVVEGNDSEKTRQQYLVDTMATLKPSDKPLSLAKASEQAMKD